MLGFGNSGAFDDARERFLQRAKDALGASLQAEANATERARLEASAAEGNVKDAVKLGLMFITGAFGLGERGRAFKLFERAASAGDADALHYLSACWSVGIGCERDERKGLELCARAAKLGCVRAIIDMGISYSEGHGVPKDLVKAARCFQLAVDRGSGDACGELAYCYLFGEGVERDVAKAKQLLELGVERGSGHAAHNLAIAYYRGEFGVAPDYKLARDYLEKSCELGSPSYYDLAMMLLRGDGIPVDFHKGLAVLKRGAAANDPASLMELGKLYLRDDMGTHHPELGIQCIERACSLDYAPACGFYATCFFEGYGVPCDPARGVKMLERAVDCGDSESAMQLAALYTEGQYGLTADRARAFKYIERAFELGELDAAAVLGYSYKNGEDVPVDIEKALRYLRAGAAAGNGACLYELAGCYADGLGVEEDWDEFRRLIFQAAEQDFSLAVGEIGMTYFGGDGFLPQDYEKAVEYLERAVELGMNECLRTLAECYAKGLGVKTDKARAKELLRRAKEAGE